MRLNLANLTMFTAKMMIWYQEKTNSEQAIEEYMWFWLFPKQH